MFNILKLLYKRQVKQVVTYNIQYLFTNFKSNIYKSLLANDSNLGINNLAVIDFRIVTKWLPQTFRAVTNLYPCRKKN